MEDQQPARVSAYLCQLQNRICSKLEATDGKGVFQKDAWTRPEGGGGSSRVLADGKVFEKAGVNFSDVRGSQLPAAASAARPHLAGAAFHAMGVSVVVHPLNPHVPTTHMNVRYFQATMQDGTSIWWFGGGFDLTPYYGYEEDAKHWHETARDACRPFGPDLYPVFKANCDRYFFLPHRNEPRGIGGIFFDDYTGSSFEDAFGLMQAVGDAFLPAYRPIVERRRALPTCDKERAFQLYRRGRYVEFNLVHDRGTLFGLQSNGRTESILMSLPPHASWTYDWTPKAGSREERLYKEFLKPRDWLAEI